MYLHFVTLKIWIYCKILIACVFPSTGYSSSWFGIMLVMITWEDKCGLTQLWGNALNMNAMGLASQFYRQMQNLCIMVVQLFMCFFNAPEKLQKHKIHRDIDFHLLCSFLMCSQIRSIFRTGDSSCVPAPAPCLLFRCLVDRPYPDNKQEDSTWILTQDDSGQYWTHHHNFHFLWVLMFACGHSGNFEVVMFPNGCCD